MPWYIYTSCKWHLKRSVDINRKLGLLSDCSFQHSFIILLTMGGASCKWKRYGRHIKNINQPPNYISLVYIQIHQPTSGGSIVYPIGTFIFSSMFFSLGYGCFSFGWNSSHMKIPKLHTSDAVENCSSSRHSGAIHLSGSGRELCTGRKGGGEILYIIDVTVLPSVKQQTRSLHTYVYLSEHDHLEGFTDLRTCAK